LRKTPKAAIEEEQNYSYERHRDRTIWNYFYSPNVSCRYANEKDIEELAFIIAVSEMERDFLKGQTPSHLKAGEITA